MKIILALGYALAIPTLPEPPRGWVRKSAAPLDHTIRLKIGFKQQNMDQMAQQLLKISTPNSPNYGQHLTAQEVRSLVEPSQKTIDTVTDWLVTNGVSKNAIEMSKGKAWLTCTVSVEKAQKLLNAQYGIYEYSANGNRLIRTTQYALPESVKNEIEVVQPTNYFGSVHEQKPAKPIQKRAVNDDFKSCANLITPSCLTNLYNMTYTPTGKSTIGVTGYLEEYASHSDLDLFMSKYRSDAKNATFSVEFVNGGINNESNPGGEANLDIQTVLGLTYPTKAKYYTTAGRPPFNPDDSVQTNSNEPYLEWLTYILDQPDSELPQVISTSYGDNEQTVPFDYATRVCNLFGKLGLRGVSVLFSSGDGGVGGSQSSACYSNDGKHSSKFLPVFPATCPYVTAVGGTRGIPETAASLSGGGFSDYFPRPDYQKAQVDSYISGIGKQYQGLYNATGRAVPDVSAQAINYAIYIAGGLEPVSGTSASAPAVAAIISNINDYQISRGKKPLGFLNPWLYSLQSGLNDIKSGSNPGCGTNGFSAASGWDPVTGLGTPNFGLMLENL